MHRLFSSKKYNTHTDVCAHDNNNLLPAQHTQNQIENEKGAEDDERDKIDPWQFIAHCILHLRGRTDRGKREEVEGQGGRSQSKE